jgi:hypothetical protein
MRRSDTCPRREDAAVRSIQARSRACGNARLDDRTTESVWPPPNFSETRALGS